MQVWTSSANSLFLNLIERLYRCLLTSEEDLRDFLRKILHRLSENEVTLLKGSIGSFFVRVLGALLGFALQVVLARLLGADSYGNYAYVWSWVNVAVLVGTLGFTTASVRFVAEYVSRQQWNRLHNYLRFSRRTVFFSSVIVSLIFAGAAFVLVAIDQRELLYTFAAGAVTVPILARMRVAEAELQGFKRVVRSKIPGQIIVPAGFIAGILVLGQVYGLEISAAEALGVNVIVSFGALIGLFALVRQAVPASASQGAKGMVLPARKWMWITVARDMLLISGFNLILFRADVIMVGALIDPTSSGLYNVASKVASLLVFALAAINSILSPIAADLYAKNKLKQLQRLITQAAVGSFVVSLVGAVIIYALRYQVLDLFGSEFVRSEGALWPLLAGQLSNAFAGPAILLLNMTGHQGLSAKILGGSALLNLALNATLIPVFGFEGAAYATMGTMFIWNALAVIGVRNRLNLKSTALSWT